MDVLGMVEMMPRPSKKTRALLENEPPDKIYKRK
jgi:hypothetical protein